MRIKIPFKLRGGNKIKPVNFRKWNLALAALFAVQGIAILMLSKPNIWSITTSFITKDQVASQVEGKTVLAPSSYELFSVNLAYFVGAVLFVAALAHLLVATIYRKQYEAGLKSGISRVRWVEYGFCAGGILATIGILSGIQDLSTLLMLFTFGVIACLMGIAMETVKQDQKQSRWLNHWVGCFAGVVPWIIFGIYAWGANVYGSGSIPTFVYFIYGSIFVLFASFAYIMCIQHRKHSKWNDFLQREQAYMVLSFATKTALAWQVFVGALR